MNIRTIKSKLVQQGNQKARIELLHFSLNRQLQPTRMFHNSCTPWLLWDTHPADLLLPPRPGTLPPILTWPAPTAPDMVTVPGSSLPISVQHKDRAGPASSQLCRVSDHWGCLVLTKTVPVLFDGIVVKWMYYAAIMWGTIILKNWPVVTTTKPPLGWWEKKTKNRYSELSTFFLSLFFFHESSQYSSWFAQWTKSRTGEQHSLSGQFIFHMSNRQQLQLLITNTFMWFT